MIGILVWQALCNSQVCPCLCRCRFQPVLTQRCILSLAVSIYSSLHKEANSRTHLSKTLLSTYVRYLRRVVKSLWQDYNLVEELPGHPVVPSLLLSVHFPLHNPCPSQVARIFKNFRSATQLSKEADRLTKLLEFHIISEFLKMAFLCTENIYSFLLCPLSTVISLYVLH